MGTIIQIWFVVLTNCHKRGESELTRETSHSRCVSTVNCLPSTVCVWWRAPFINQPSSSQVRVRTGTLQNSNSLSSCIYQLTNPKEATQTDTLTDQKWTPVSRGGTTLNARGGGGVRSGEGTLLCARGCLEQLHPMRALVRGAGRDWTESCPTG